MVVSSFSCSGISTGDLNPIYNVPMLGTHKALLSTAGAVVFSACCATINTTPFDHAHSIPSRERVRRSVTMNMKLFPTLLMALTALIFPFAMASPIDDLASPDQMVRDKAAAEQRATFQRIPESKWTPTIEKLKKGQSKKEVLDQLLQFTVIGKGGAGDESYANIFRLDDEWVLICRFKNNSDLLIDTKLDPSLKRIDVSPPRDYTGKWVIYYINGNKSHEINFKDGRYFGEFIAYDLHGSKCFVQHYTESGLDGDYTVYYPSGKVTTRGQYKEGKQVGTWTSYDEAGKVASTKEHPNP